jgi:hypothetical protein
MEGIEMTEAKAISTALAAASDRGIHRLRKWTCDATLPFEEHFAGVRGAPTPKLAAGERTDQAAAVALHGNLVSVESILKSAHTRLEQP